MGSTDLWQTASSISACHVTLPHTASDGRGLPVCQIDYGIWVAKQVHRRGMNVGLKNSLGMVQQLKRHYDWFLNEQCNGTTQKGFTSVCI